MNIAETGAPPSRSPTKDQFNEVIDKQAASIETQLQEVAPVGDYSAIRVNNLGKALDEVVALFGAPIPPVAKSGDIKKGKLPLDILLRLAAVRDACQAYKEVNPDDQYDVPDIATLSNDASLALVTTVLQRLAKDKGFKSFLKEPAPTSAPVTAEEPAPIEAAGINPQAAQDLSTVFGK